MSSSDTEWPDTQSGRQDHNEASSEEVAGLLEFLATWTSVAVKGFRGTTGIDLRMSAASTTDEGHLYPRLKLPLPHTKEWKEDRCISSFVGFRDDTFYKTPPEVPVVRSFTCGPIRLDRRRIIPTNCCEIASWLPSLRDIRWDLADGGHDYAFRVWLRAAALSPSPSTSEPPLPLKSLRQLNLWHSAITSAFKIGYENLKSDDEFHDGVVDLDPQLCPEGTPDVLSVVLAALSMRMETVDLRGTIGQELWSSLRPEGEREGEGDERGCRQAFPFRLRKLNVRVYTHTPQGTFQYRYNPQSGPDLARRDQPSDGSKQMENEPTAEMGPAWFEAACAAKGRMPDTSMNAQFRKNLPAKLLWPNGKRCGPFAPMMGYADE
ncbi:hypothetical protein PG993_012007 [Apiospora rasikravindrae]|uniref:Uncharacterized protein n=1 Tax=Apiospora rasikravindrae TaxID=990691 RepID=A0ABR1S198_9PEZI